jgi:hypothetical protein
VFEARLTWPHKPNLFIKLELAVADIACGTELALSDPNYLTAACPLGKLRKK